MWVCIKVVVPLDYFVKASIAELISRHYSNDFSYLKEWGKFIGARDFSMTYDQVKNFQKTADISDMKFQNSKTHSETSREISWNFAINFTKFQLKFQHKFHLKFPFYRGGPMLELQRLPSSKFSTSNFPRSKFLLPTFPTSNFSTVTLHYIISQPLI